MYYQDLGSHETTLGLLLQDRRRRSRIQRLLHEARVEEGHALPSRRCQFLGLLGRWLVAWGRSLEGYAVARTQPRVETG